MRTHQSKRIYLDHGASTPVDPRVLDAMAPYWSEKFGNPGSIHTEGNDASTALYIARSTVAQAIHCRPEQVVFTSGGTESNNLAIRGVVRRAIQEGRKPETIHIITSAVEHSSVRACAEDVEREGVQVTYVGVDEEGRILIDELKTAITENTLLVSFVYVNNEIGTIQNVREIVKVLHASKGYNNTSPLLHLDASQAPVWMGIQVDSLSVDFLTLGGQKIYAPKGVGCLYVRNHDYIAPCILGGGQEYGLRAGTPAIPLIVGFAKALQILEEERHMYVDDCRASRDWFISRVLDTIPDVILNGPTGDTRVIGTMHFSCIGLDAEQIVIELDARGIAVGTGSACRTSMEHGASHVLRAIRGISNEETSSDSVRMTMSRHTTREELEQVYYAFKEVIEWLRAGN